MKYFISYRWTAKKDSGFGNVGFKTGKEIKDFSDLIAIQKALEIDKEKEHNFTMKICIINFIKLSE